MKLNQWIELSGTTRSQFARNIGASRASVTRWCKGDRRPEPHFAYHIQLKTEGSVSVEEWGYNVKDVSTGVQTIWRWLFIEGLTVTQGAQRLGVWPMTLRGWLAGAVPSEANLKKLSDHLWFEITADDFKNIRENDDAKMDRGRTRDASLSVSA